MPEEFRVIEDRSNGSERTYREIFYSPPSGGMKGYWMERILPEYSGRAVCLDELLCRQLDRVADDIRKEELAEEYGFLL